MCSLVLKFSLFPLDSLHLEVSIIVSVANSVTTKNLRTVDFCVPQLFGQPIFEFQFKSKSLETSEVLQDVDSESGGTAAAEDGEQQQENEQPTAEEEEEEENQRSPEKL